MFGIPEPTTPTGLKTSPVNIATPPVGAVNQLFTLGKTGTPTLSVNVPVCPVVNVLTTTI